MARSFIKWVGGKGRAMPSLLPILTSVEFKDYHEPFLGGGAAFLSLAEMGRVHGAVLGDINTKLICAWQQVKECPLAVIRELLFYEAWDGKHFYLAVRERFNAREPDSEEWGPGEYAAAFIYLNRAGYNGLYRENLSGEFNVPFCGPPHRKLGVGICYRDEILFASHILQDVVLHSMDFEEALEWVKPGDLVYADSPYHKAGQSMYTAREFSEDDQRRLAWSLLDVVNRGAHVVASNADTPLIRELYSEFDQVPSTRLNSVNQDPEDRGPRPDLILVSF